MIVSRVRALGEAGDHVRVDVDLLGDVAEHRPGQHLSSPQVTARVAQAA